MASYPGLYKRGGVYHVKRRVPLDVRPLEKREQIAVSLRTSDYRQAVAAYRYKMAEIEAEIDRLRSALAFNDRINPALHEGRLELLTERDLEALALRWFEGRSKNRRPARGSGALSEREMLDELNDLAAELSDPDQSVTNDAVRSVTDQLLVAAGIVARPRSLGRSVTGVRFPEVDHSSEHYVRLAQLVRRGLIIENELAREHLSGRAIAQPDPLFNPTTGNSNHFQQPNRGAGGVTVKQLIAAYRRERDATYGQESTDRKYGHIFRALEEALGPDKAIGDITRDDCRAVRDLLREVPSNSAKHYPGLSLQSAVAAAKRDKAPTLAPNTVGSYMNNLRAVLNWAVEEEWLARNPAKGLVEKARPSVKRRGFTADELGRLFKALASEHARTPSHFWVPALALYTGARAGEICQLRVQDVVVVDGVHCLDLSEFDADGFRVDDKSIKNASSVRRVPLHSQLVTAGFLKFVQRQEAALEDRLFPDLEPRPNAAPSHELSKWFGRFLTRIGMAQPSLVFHSFRHGFRDACRRADVPEETAKALGGWAATGQASLYGDRAMVEVLHAACEKLEFGAFCLPTVAATRARATRPRVPHSIGLAKRRLKAG